LSIEKFKELTPGWHEKEYLGYSIISDPGNTYGMIVGEPSFLKSPMKLVEKALDYFSKLPERSPVDEMTFNILTDIFKNMYEEDIEFIKVKSGKIDKNMPYNYKKNGNHWAYAGHILNSIDTIFSSGYQLYLPNVPVIGYAKSGNDTIIFSPVHSSMNNIDFIELDKDTQLSFEQVEDELW